MKLKMTLKMIAIALTGLLAFGVNAEDEKPSAPSTVLAEARQLCQEDANDSGIEADDLGDYLLACVNEELESQGYQAVDSL